MSFLWNRIFHLKKYMAFQVQKDILHGFKIQIFLISFIIYSRT